MAAARSPGFGVFLAIAILSTAIGVPAFAQSSRVFTWNAPTTNADNSPLTDLAGYEIGWGRSSRSYPNLQVVRSAVSGSVTFAAPGTYFVAVRAFDTSGNRSAFSNELSVVVTSNPTPTPSVTPSPTPSATPPQTPTPPATPPQTPTPPATPPQTPTPIGDIDGSIPGDMNADGRSDVLAIVGSTFRVHRSTSELIGGGTISEGSIRSLSYLSYGNTDTAAGDELVGVLRKGREWQWVSIDPSTGVRRDLRRFGATNERPLLGCQSGGQVLPAVSSRGRSGWTVRLGLTTPRGLTLPRETKELLCSRNRIGNSVILARTSTRAGYVIQSYDLNGRLLSTSPIFPKGTRYLQMLSLPAVGGSGAAHGVLVVRDRALQLLLAGQDGWRAYNTGLQATSILGLSVGSDAAGKRWLVVVLRNRTVHSIQIPASAGNSVLSADLIEALSGTRKIVK